MAAKISADVAKTVKQTFKTFVNLLKEFPRDASDEFVYDESTLKKIEDAAEALSEMSSVVKKNSGPLEKDVKAGLKESLDTLHRLMDELPKDPSDEFLYDRSIHQMVEDARETIVRLGALFN